MIAQNQRPEHDRIVFTGVGLTAPNGNNLDEFRDSLLNGRSGVRRYEIRYVGETLAGVCDSTLNGINHGKTSVAGHGPAALEFTARTKRLGCRGWIGGTSIGRALVFTLVSPSMATLKPKTKSMS